MTTNQGWVEISGPCAQPGFGPRVRDVLAELNLNVDVRVRGGLGVEPWVEIVIAAPFSIFFAKFLDLAAQDSYGALKKWLKKLPARLHNDRDTLELRDLDNADRRITVRLASVEDSFPEFATALAVEMQFRGLKLARTGDKLATEQAIVLYKQAFDLKVEPNAKMYTACWLVVLLERLGGEAALKESEVWYRRAVDLDSDGRVARRLVGEIRAAFSGD